jgi:phosphatidylserine/phosphatidylglycerophosphate/cardiolipin synthase-like enzyme
VRVRLLVDFSAPVFQHRSHRKLLIVDGETVLTGGRNIANEYFDLSDRYNFLDSDFEVSGPIVKTVLGSFDVYWNSRLATEPAADSRPNAEAAKFVIPNERDVALLRKLRAAGEVYRQSHKAYECRDMAARTT